MLALIVAIVAVILLLPSCGGNSSKKAGDKAPDFTVEMFGGGKTDLAELKGKVVLLNFWATWCPPCRQELARVPLIPCTSCNYCAKVCPAQIGISGSLTAMNSLTLYGNRAAAVGQENWLVGRHGRQSADKCQQCGACEKVCPQHLPIRKYLKQVCQALLND